MVIRTKSGLRHLDVTVMGSEVESVRMNMGAASLFPVDIPVRLFDEAVVGCEVVVDGQPFEILIPD